MFEKFEKTLYIQYTNRIFINLIRRTRIAGKNKKAFFRLHPPQHRYTTRIGPLAQGLEHRPYKDLTQKKPYLILCVASIREAAVPGSNPGWTNKFVECWTVTFQILFYQGLRLYLFVNLDSILVLVDGFRAVIGILFGLFALAIYWKVRNDSDLAMSSFQLNKEEIKQDYRIILYANIMMVFALVAHILGAMNIIGLLTGSILRTVYIAVIAFVLIRWVRNFR